MTSSQARETIDGKAIECLVEGQAIRSATVLGQPGGWAVMVRYGAVERVVAVQRTTTPRLWRTLQAAAGYVLEQLRLSRFDVDAAGFEPGKSSSRPDQAKRMREAHQAAEYDAWFREQVQIGIDANAGDVLTSDEMEAEAAVWRAEIQRRMTDGSAS